MKKIFSEIYKKASVREALHIYELAFLFTGLIVVFMLSVLMPLFGTQKVSRWMLQSVIWSISSTKINYMQSMFQLGTATSIAFAIAGPQIKHALGPRAQRVIRYVNFSISGSSGPALNLRKLVDVLKNFDKYTQDYWELGRGNLFKLHLIAALINFLMLFWSSLIDPRGQILNGIAFVLIMYSMFVPLADLYRTYIKARHIRPMLQEAKNACDSGTPDRIDAICAKIEAETKPLPPNI